MNAKLGSWNRAWGGRLVHFERNGKALCGARPKRWHYSAEWWWRTMYAKCQKCEGAYGKQLEQSRKQKEK